MATSPAAGASGDDVGRRTFSTSFRGFDQAEVRTYLEVVAEEFAALRARVSELEAELEAAARPGADKPLDAAALTRLVGEETARVLRAAQEAADDLRTRAEEGAARTLAEAHEQATALRSAAEAVLAERTIEAEQVGAAVLAEAKQKSEKMIGEARSAADRTVTDAIEQGRDMVGQAKAARERVLADLGRRRRSGLAHVEQLRAGRERLVGSFDLVRAELERITADLAAADEVARRATDAAAPETESSAPAPPVIPVPVPTPGPEPEPATVVGEPQPATVVEEPEPQRIEPQRIEPEQLESMAEKPAPDAETPEPAQIDHHPVDHHAEDVTEDALIAEEALISAPRKGSKRQREPAPAPVRATRPGYDHDTVPAASLPASAVGEAPGAIAVDVSDAEAPRKADELFARIRADRAAATSDARAVLEAPVESAELEAPRTDAEETYLQRRDGLVEAVHGATVRGLRRALADDQNTALDRFRTLRPGAVDVDALLGVEAEQIRSWAGRAATGLAEGAQAGAQLACGGPAGTLDAAIVAPIAERLATELVAPLRVRLTAVVEAVGRDRGTDTVERINSVYREWRSRIDRAVGDAVTEAVSAGFRASLADGAPVSWVVEDVDGPCPDCDDNALAGVIALGEQFPTGQVTPPAHPGCRCVLSRAST